MGGVDRYVLGLGREELVVGSFAMKLKERILGALLKKELEVTN